MIDLKKRVTESKYYEENFVKVRLQVIAAGREEMKQLEAERAFE